MTLAVDRAVSLFIMTRCHMLTREVGEPGDWDQRVLILCSGGEERPLPGIYVWRREVRLSTPPASKR